MGETTSVNRGWQERLVEPHPAITGERDRQQTRALSWLTLITTPVIFIATLLGGTLFTIEAIILLLAMVAGYGLSRTPRAGIGKLVTLLGLTLPVMVVPFVNPEVFTPLIGDGTLIDLIQVLVMYMAFPMFLSVVIVDARQASAVNFIIWAGMIAVTLNVPEVTLASEVIPLTILALIGITASIVAFLRERDQDVIIQEVQKREEINRSLENRVQERTNDLATSAEIASAANQVRQLEELISLAVNLIRDRFGFYYVQIYLLDETGEYAELADGTGYVGRRLVGQNHRLSMRQDTIVTEAIKSGQSNVIQDVSQHPTFLQNELLPDTKAELAVPLRAQDKVIGALDIQADETDVFEESERRLFETLADQLAVTFENAQLFQQSEERARQLETVAQVSIEASTSLDLKELLRSVSKLTRDNFDLYHAHIYLLQNDTLLLSGGAGEAGLLMVEQGHSISLHMEHSLVARAARSGQPVLSNDIREEPDYLPNELLPNTRSELALPLLAGENVIGVMDVQSDRVNEFDDTDIQIHSTLAAQVSVAVQNARAFAEADAAREEARIREQRFRTLLENAPEAIFVLDGNTGRFTEVNRVTEKTFGYSEDELTDMTPLDLSPEYQSDGQLTETVVGSTVQKALRGEEAQTQWEGFTRDGERRVFDMRLVRLPGADNLLRVSATDITEARQIQRLRDVQFNISQKLNAAQNPQEILEAVVQFASESGLSMGNLYYTSNVGRQEPEEVLCVAAWSDNEEIEPTPVGTSFKLNQFAVVRRWMDEPEKVLLHENVIDDPRVDDATQAVYETIGVKAAGVIPLYQGGRWIGLYIFGWQDAQIFGQFEASILESVRQQSIAVVDAVQSAEQLRKRADELAVVAEVGTAAASILDVDRLLKTVSDLTKEKFALYHAHVYLLDDSGKYRVLKLAAGAGEVGDLMVSGAHQIRYDREGSIVAGAARNRQTYIVNDVTAEADFLPNPLLPETRAELAVPMIASDNLVGVLDVQSEKASYFTQEDAQVLQTLATQVAVAIDNAQLFAQSQERAAQLETVAQVATQASSNVDLDEMLRTVSNLTKEKFNLYHAHIYLLDSSGSRLNLAAGAGEAGLKMVQSKHKIALNKQESLVATAARNQQNVIVNDVTAEDNFLPNPLLPDTRAELSVPMTVGDELIGVLDVQSSRAAAFDDEDARVLQILATQLAVAVKNARLFKDVNDIRFAIDQHAIVAITDQTGKIQYANQKFADISKFEIDELIGQDHRIINSGYHSKEFIRNLWTTIANGQVWKGEIKNQTREGNYYWVDTTIVPFMNSEGKPYQYIAIRTNITEQKRAQEDIRRRARELESAALVSAETASELDADKLLWAVANLTKEEFNRYHAHIYLANQNTQSLDLVAGAGATGRLMVNEGHSIPLNAESLVARAARDRTPVLINDVMGDKDFLPNPNLPETRSEMAVPIVYGDQLLGVLDIQDDEPDAFDEVERQVFSTLTNQIGVALQNARTFELTQRRLDEVMANNRISEYVRADVSLEAMLENVFQVVLDTLQPTNIVMSRYDADEQRWRGMIGVGMDMTTETAKTFDDPVGTYPHGMEALESGEIVLVEDVREYPDFPQNYIEDLGLASVLVIPLIVEGDPYGVAFLNYVDEQRLFTSEDTRLSRSIANQVSTALERRVAQERIRQQSALVETSEDFIGIATLDGEALYLNPAGHALTRYEAGDVIGEPIVMFYPDYERERLNDEIMPAVMNEGRWRGEVDFIRKDGSTFPVDHTLFIITDKAGNPLNIATVSTDITERTRQQQRQFTLLKLSSLLNDAQSPEDVLDVFVTYGTEQGALSSAILFYMAGEMGQQNGGGPLPDELIASATWHAEDMQLVVEPGVRYDMEVFPSAKDWMDNPYAPVIYEDTQQAQVC